MQVVHDTAEYAMQDVQEYAHMNRGPGDVGDVILIATDHCGFVAAQLRKDNLSAM